MGIVILVTSVDHNFKHLKSYGQKHKDFKYLFLQNSIYKQARHYVYHIYLICGSFPITFNYSS